MSNPNNLQHLIGFVLLLSQFFIFLSHANVPRPSFSNLLDVSSRFPSLSFEDSYSVLWGEPAISEDGNQIQLRLDDHSGSGFVSHDNYLYGFYSASIKLPADYTAGIVLAFYASNSDEFPKYHDELDFEFLGNVKGKPWRMQTNIYGNGSVARGREERFNLWFDPTTGFHDYSILWNDEHIVFMVDNIPIREMRKSEALGGDYPSKPMALYATMWDGSPWATDGGKYPVNYKYAPFFTSFRNLKLIGCAANPIVEEQQSDQCKDLENQSAIRAAEMLSLSSDQLAALKWVRSNHLYYTYCDDKGRYSVPLPECTSEASTPVAKKRRPHKKRSGRSTHSTPANSGQRERNLIERTEGLQIERSQTGLREGFSLPISRRVPHKGNRKTQQ